MLLEPLIQIAKTISLEIHGSQWIGCTADRYLQCNFTLKMYAILVRVKMGLLIVINSVIMMLPPQPSVVRFPFHFFEKCRASTFSGQQQHCQPTHTVPRTQCNSFHFKFRLRRKQNQRKELKWEFGAVDKLKFIRAKLCICPSCTQNNPISFQCIEGINTLLHWRHRWLHFIAYWSFASGDGDGSKQVTRCRMLWCLRIFLISIDSKRNILGEETRLPTDSSLTRGIHVMDIVADGVLTSIP